MLRPYLLASLAFTALATSAMPAASAGTCVTERVPRRGDVTICTTEQGCLLYADPGGRTIAACVPPPVDTDPFAGCTNEGLPGPYQVCFLTEECTLFVTNGRPPGLCL